MEPSSGMTSFIAQRLSLYPDRCIARLPGGGAADDAAIAAHDKPFARGGIVPKQIDLVAAIGRAAKRVEGDAHRERIDEK